MDKYIDAEALKKEIAKAPVWTSLTITEIIDKMPDCKDKPQTEVDWKQKLCDMYGTDRKSFDEAWKKYETDKVTDEPQTDYNKSLELFAEVLFDKEKSEQFLKECKAMGIEPQTDCPWKKGE